MDTKDIQQFFDENWKGFLKPITELSKDHQSQTPLVNDDSIAYDFDMISKELFGGRNVPTSTDGLLIHAHTIELIEFKSGFKQRITRENFNPQTGACPCTGKVCNDYWDLFFENQKRKINELITSIRFKAIESYITLEKHILPQYAFSSTTKINLTIVIDEDGIDEMEDDLLELSKSTHKENNCFQRIRSALSRQNKRKDATGNNYYYDRINIISYRSFSCRQCE